jgi:hypothetical protein
VDVTAVVSPASVVRETNTGPRRTNWVLTISVSAAIALTILLLTRPVASWLAELPMNTDPVAPSPEPLPMVHSMDALLAQARWLQASGRTGDALRVLDRVDPSDPLRSEADRLRAELQRDAGPDRPSASSSSDTGSAR